MTKELFKLKYTILRRAICTHCHSEDLKKINYSREDLEKLCYELEAKTLKELKKIHKKWVGY